MINGLAFISTPNPTDIYTINVYRDEVSWAQKRHGGIRDCFLYASSPVMERSDVDTSRAPEQPIPFEVFAEKLAAKTAEAIAWAEHNREQDLGKRR